MVSYRRVPPRLGPTGCVPALAAFSNGVGAVVTLMAVSIRCCAWSFFGVRATEYQVPKMGLLKRVEDELVRPILRWARPSRHVRFADIDISYRSGLDGGEQSLGNSSLRSFSRGECRNRSGPSNGAHDRASSASPSSGTVYVRPFAYLTSTRPRFLRAGIQCEATSSTTASLFINPTTSKTFHVRKSGI